MIKRMDKKYIKELLIAESNRLCSQTTLLLHKLSGHREQIKNTELELDLISKNLLEISDQLKEIYQQEKTETFEQ